MGKRTTGRRGQSLRQQPDTPRINVDRLALWRAQRAGNPAAVRAWARLKARAEELKSQWAFERYGLPLEQCGFAQLERLHAEALDVATAEL
ncbi:hypothetical protein [Mycobacterium pseudokansasii]|uniref:hypothetical protein n=1 Tax=Mycobacterium pseudokansasii TaxID=2341080 RepID=UPI0010A969A0|nr:hypothetical protein [Mycobacterium pseudokansasii]